ncbi:MAG TPA: FtsQ-type POTRA domain-containing protein [Verrucomicrobiales bacterium]|nr:FtsQ-type POTRA domain-containing protein [Verrucomicrobiales bacterium]
MARIKDEVLFEERMAAAVRSRSRHFIRLGPGGMPRSKSNRARWERRRRIGQAIFTAVVGGIAVWGSVFLHRAVLANEDLIVRDVRIRTDGVLTQEEILKAAGPLAGRHIVQVNIARIEEALQRHPLVERAAVERRFPATVSIALHERRPVAWLVDPRNGYPGAGEKGALVDRKGVVVLCDAVRGEYLRLPSIVVGPDIRYSLDDRSGDDGGPPVGPGERIESPAILAAIGLNQILKPVTDSLGLQVVRYELYRHYYVNAVFASGLTVRFLPERFRSQAARLEETVRHCVAEGFTATSIDLTLDETIPVKGLVPRARVVPEEIPGEDLPPEPLPEEIPEEFIPESVPGFPVQPTIAP